jgi:hypothetical protein
MGRGKVGVGDGDGEEGRRWWRIRWRERAFQKRKD